ncbi:MAG: hydroxyacylglutathione hydrolase [Caulobacterales bacterium]
MASLQIHMFPCLNDNYGFLIHDPQSGETASIDTPEAGPILAAAKAKGWTITQIWNTHWHPDHAGGNAAIKAETGCVIYGPKGEAAKIPMIDHAVDDGDQVRLGQYEARVLNVGGHTMGHIAYHFPSENVAFVGDTLFALGCGRVFEGTPQQMWTSLSKLAALPPETKIYCAHEYTQSNARFAITIEPDNAALQARKKSIDAARTKGEPTVPTTIAAELASNPFLRADTASVREAVDLKQAPAWQVFAEVRRRKDTF